MRTRTCLLTTIALAAGLSAFTPSAAAEGAGIDPWPLCQQLFVGPDIDQGVCVDPAGDCVVLYYDTYGTGGGDRCYVSDPGVSVVRVDRCERIFYGPDIDSGVCVDSAAGAGCYAWIYNAYGRDTCLVPAVVSASAADETCWFQFEQHDWQRTSYCTSVKGDCKAYMKHEGVNPGRTCLHPQGV